MAALLAVHGFPTPGQLVGSNGLVALTGGVTLPIGGAILALTALPRLSRPRRVLPMLIVQAALLLAIVGASVAGMLDPGLVPGVPSVMSNEALALLAVGLLFYGIVGYRAFNTWLLTRRRADLLVVFGIVWLAAALAAALTMDYRSLGWWLGHAFEVIGIGLVGAVVAYDMSRSAQSRTIFGDLKAAQLVSSEEQFLGSHVRSLVVSLADKDVYTEGHTRRVATLAVEIGELLGLAPQRLRLLAAGGLLHDIGKLAVPDAVLKKPDSLTPEELRVIREHPDRGARLLTELGGFPEMVRGLVRWHHERLDGSGYPDGLAGDALDMETRILATCDVYDAVVSNRCYRDARTHDDAMAVLRAEPAAFDMATIDALETVLARRAEPGEAAEPDASERRAA
jgi:putative nucleotidyltransferase with HDIG domain